MWSNLTRASKCAFLLKTCSKSLFRPRHIHTRKIDPSKLVATQTVQQLRDELTKIMGVRKEYYPPIDRKHDRAYLNEYLPSNQAELPARTMDDSFCAAIIPLSQDVELQDKYVTFMGKVRLGRLLEDMDIFAVYVVQKHLYNPKQPKDTPSPYTLVTALVDKIEFVQVDFETKPNEDIRLSGHVSWVGRSSIEVVVWLEQKNEGVWKKLTRALFVMAARSATGEHSAIVNSLVATTEEEQKILDDGENRKQQRLVRHSQDLHKVLPTMEEQKVIHDLFLRTRESEEISLVKQDNLPPNCAWMKACTLSNLIFSQPENRNLHNNVFGGFLMRQALELSWALGYVYSKHHPSLICISNITFHQPVMVNSLIRMTAHVVYTDSRLFHITVLAEAVNSVSGKDVTANLFHFTYEVPVSVREVFPKSYKEAMAYIDGRRHFCDLQHRINPSTP